MQNYCNKCGPWKRPQDGLLNCVSAVSQLLTPYVNRGSWWVSEVWVCVHSVHQGAVFCVHWCFLWSELCIRKHKICLSLKSFANVSIIQINLHFQNKRCSRTDYKGESISKPFLSSINSQFLSYSTEERFGHCMSLPQHHTHLF